jgi:hypothetical protein
MQRVSAEDYGIQQDAKNGSEWKINQRWHNLPLKQLEHLYGAESGLVGAYERR